VRIIDCCITQRKAQVLGPVTRVKKKITRDGSVCIHQVCITEEGSCLRIIESCITQRKAQVLGPVTRVKKKIT